MSDSHFMCPKLFWKDDAFVHIISIKGCQRRSKIKSLAQVPNLMF